jgi:signal peptidase II
LKKAVITVFIILFLDQFVKIWIKTNMFIGEEIYVIGNWFRIKFIENNGMAFGMELAGEYGKVFLSIFRIVACTAIGYYISILIKKKAHPGLIITVSMIFAGALGNIIDSAFYGLIFSESNYMTGNVAEIFPKDGGYAGFLHGKVVDMLYFPLFEGYFPEWMPFFGGEHFLFFRPIFNISDAAITIGVILIVIFQKKFFGTAKTKKTTEEVKTDNTTCL